MQPQNWPPGALPLLAVRRAMRLPHLGQVGGLAIRPIRLISLIGPISGLLPLAQAFGGELLGVAAVLDEGLLQGGDLPVEQVVRLVDEADKGVGSHRGVGVIEPAGVERVALVVGKIGQI